MRAYGHNGSQGPSWLIAIAVFIIAIVMVQVMRDRSGGASALQQQFAAQPPSDGIPNIDLPPLPDDIAGIARTAVARLRTGAPAPALTPVAQNQRLRIEISGMEQVAEGLKISGSIVNTGTEPLPVSLNAFQFVDSSGTTYTTQGDAATTLAAGQRAPLDLVLPIENPQQLTLRVQLDGDAPIEMVLLQS